MKFNLNYIVGGLLLATLGYFLASTYFYADKPPPSQLPWTPIDVGKSKVYVSQTRDAGMRTEFMRRAAIIRNPDPLFSYKGFTNGVVEYYLTGVLAGIQKVCPSPPPNVIWDGGDASSNVCDIVDGGNAESEYDVVDFGNAETNDCDI